MNAGDRSAQPHLTVTGEAAASKVNASSESGASAKLDQARMSGKKETSSLATVPSSEATTPPGNSDQAPSSESGNGGGSGGGNSGGSHGESKAR